MKIIGPAAGRLPRRNTRVNVQGSAHRPPPLIVGVVAAWAWRRRRRPARRGRHLHAALRAVRIDAEAGERAVHALVLPLLLRGAPLGRVHVEPPEQHAGRQHRRERDAARHHVPVAAHVLAPPVDARRGPELVAIGQAAAVKAVAVAGQLVVKVRQRAPLDELRDGQVGRCAEGAAEREVAAGEDEHAVQHHHEQQAVVVAI
mmetsp:Transcript_26972/g.79991  ORF Transcript_26972/g.79991 Transcript_26972/m.79991 type:complete len:202 (-) Transcript_26972:708-1313(-)